MNKFVSSIILAVAALAADGAVAQPDGFQVAVSSPWDVVVTATYINDKVKIVGDIPVMHVLVREGQCVKGLTRAEKMIPKEIPVTQEICVERDSGGRAMISGWVFVTKRITDTAFEGARGAQNRGELNYGMPIRITTDGTFVRSQTGPYTITATQPKPI